MAIGVSRLLTYCMLRWSHGSSGRQGNCGHTCDKNERNTFPVIRSFLLVRELIPKPLPRGIIHPTAARFLQNRFVQETVFLGFTIIILSTAYTKSAAGAQPQKPCFCVQRGLGMLPQQAQVSGHLPCLLLLTTWKSNLSRPLGSYRAEVRLSWVWLP